MYVFDLSDGSSRLLRERSGHAGAVSSVRFHGSDGTTILSSGSDQQVRRHSIFRDEQGLEMSQRALSRAIRIGNRRSRRSRQGSDPNGMFL